MHRLAVVCILMGCGGRSPIDTGESLDGSFTTVRDDVLLLSCAFNSCHGAGAGGLTLDEQGAYDALVGVDASNGQALVVPGDPNGSYLIQKMEGSSDIEGDVMPPSGSLDDAKIGQVRTWIEDGAHDD